MKKKHIFALLMLCLILFVLPAKAEAATTVASGKLDHTVSWKLTSDGVLRISGNRSMQEVKTFPWEKYSSRITKIVVADGVTNICDRAFSHLDKVTSVYLGDAVKSIGEEAFYCCTSLESVKIPAAVTEIGKDAFWNCISLKKLTFASGCKLKTIGEDAFSKTAIETLKTPASLRTIEAGAFSRCLNLKTITISDGVQTVKSGVFEGCKNVEKVVISKTVTSWGSWNFDDMQNLSHVEIYSGAVPPDFSENEKLKTAVLGGSVTGRSMDFGGCKLLTEVTLSAPLTQIPVSAFRGCSALKSLQIPDTVTEIGNFAFYESGITRLVLPASLEELDFKSLSNPALETVIFKGDAPNINTYAFSGVTATVYYPKNNVTWTESVRQDYKGDLTWVEAGDPVSITKQPEAAPVDAGQRITVTVEAAGDGLTYKWYYKNPDASGFAFTSSFTGSSYSAVMNADRDGRQVYCLITDRYGNQVKTETVTLRIRSPLKIVQQPQDVVAASGKRANMCCVKNRQQECMRKLLKCNKYNTKLEKF